MKEANNNAVDLLLRSLARGETADARSGKRTADGGGMGLEHLDADELNLYSEGLLSPPARARYTEHLADCRRCRTIVAGLAQSAGLTISHEEKRPSDASFWSSLAAFFSIPVLRYAIPALLLTGMISIGLVAFRNRPASDLVAVNQQAVPATPVVESNADTQPTPANGLTIPETPGGSTVASANVAKNAPAENPGLLSQSNDTAAQGRGEGAVSKDAAAPLAGAAPAQPVYAPEVYPAPPPKAAEERDAKSALQKEKQEHLEREVANRNQDEVKLAAKDDSPRHGPARSRSMSGGSRRDEDVTVTESRVAGLKATKPGADKADTISVSGRSFRRGGNAWIDTAYNSGRGVTNVSRGSEQFRSLMADEPGLRAIVQQLGGEVIVVWKNRAYRIR